MNWVLVAIAAALVGCAPDMSKIVDSYEVEGLTIQSEVPLQQTAIGRDVVRIRRVLDEVGVVGSSQFNGRFGNLLIIVRDTYDLQPWRNSDSGVTAGMHRGNGAFYWIELTRDGQSLGHELMHDVGLCDHDSRNHWELDSYNAAEQDFDANNGHWN